MKGTRNTNSTTYVIPTSIMEAFDNGVILITENPEWNMPDTPQTSRDSALALKEIVGDNYCGILFMPSGKLYQSRESVKAWDEVIIGEVANAVVVKSFGARLLGNFALKFTSKRAPIKLFDNREEAEKWLLKEILRAKLGKNK